MKFFIFNLLLFLLLFIGALISKKIRNDDTYSSGMILVIVIFISMTISTVLGQFTLPDFNDSTIVEIDEFKVAGKYSRRKSAELLHLTLEKKDGTSFNKDITGIPEVWDKAIVGKNVIIEKHKAKRKLFFTDIIEYENIKNIN